MYKFYLSCFIQIILFALCLFNIKPASAATFTVGTGAGCGFSTIQAAVNAAQAAPDPLPIFAPDTVIVTRTLTYTAQAISVTGSGVVSIVGGYANCNSTGPTNPNTEISGAGGGDDSVITMTGTGGLFLSNLDIIDGDEVAIGAFGGGIDFRSPGFLTLNRTNVRSNNAPNGGGIYANGTGPNAIVRLENDNILSSNSAEFGGGIYLEGTIVMEMLGPGNLIALNEADNRGGGIYAQGRARIELGSGTVLGTITSNTANIGGAISLSGSDSSAVFPLVRMYPTDANQAPSISGNGNQAAIGGVIDLLSTGGGRAGFCVMDSNFINNEGGFSLFYGLIGGLSTNQINASFCAWNSIPTPRRVECATSTECNVIRNNAMNALIFDTAGSEFNRLRIFDNQAAILSATHNNFTVFRNSLIYKNTSPASPFVLSASARMVMRETTVADNNFPANTVLVDRGMGNLFLQNTILWQPNRVLTSTLNAPAPVSALYSLLSETNSISSSANVFQISTSQFINPANNDYRLSDNALALDFAPTENNPSELDLAGNLREVDLTNIANFAGPRDAGALELQPLLSNGFE